MKEVPPGVFTRVVGFDKVPQLASQFRWSTSKASSAFNNHQVNETLRYWHIYPDERSGPSSTRGFDGWVDAGSGIQLVMSSSFTLICGSIGDPGAVAGAEKLIEQPAEAE